MSWRALSEGRSILLPLLALAGLGLWGSWPAVWMPAVLLIAMVAAFFRDPTRVIPPEPDLIVAPADGLVDTVERPDHIEAIGGPGLRISIFLSVLDVHINRFPCAGTVREIVHQPGRFFDARSLASHRQNENRLWQLDTPHGPVAVRQIAGLIARRIVGWVRRGERVERGERLGLIRFGSRTDLYLPAHAEALVEPGAIVRGGSSVVARFPAASDTKHAPPAP